MASATEMPHWPILATWHKNVSDLPILHNAMPCQRHINKGMCQAHGSMPRGLRDHGFYVVSQLGHGRAWLGVVGSVPSKAPFLNRGTFHVALGLFPLLASWYLPVVLPEGL
ncbi:hypothetical protein R1flu_026948 [Riccia fluitans]|uniref:Uncharacterized protein n=1 Tax=Riccia fluitans TaxID=41844 RepID=A0ABD1XHD4_9MARC